MKMLIFVCFVRSVYLRSVFLALSFWKRSITEFPIIIIITSTDMVRTGEPSGGTSTQVCLLHSSRSLIAMSVDVAATDI